VNIDAFLNITNSSNVGYPCANDIQGIIKNNSINNNNFFSILYHFHKLKEVSSVYLIEQQAFFYQIKIYFL